MAILIIILTVFLKGSKQFIVSNDSNDSNDSNNSNDSNGSNGKFI